MLYKERTDCFIYTHIFGESFFLVSVNIYFDFFQTFEISEAKIHKYRAETRISKDVSKLNFFQHHLVFKLKVCDYVLKLLVYP